MKVVRNKTFPEQTHPSSVSSLSAPIQSCTSIGQQPVFGNTGMAVSGMSDSMNSANAAGNLGRLDLTKISQLLAQNQGGGAMQAPAAHSMSSNGNGNAAANPTMLSALLSMATGGNNSNLAPPPQLQQTQQQQPPLVQSLAALLPALNGQPQPSQQQVQQQRPPNGVADLLALLRGNKPSEVHFSATAAAPASSISGTNRGSSSSDSDSSLSQSKMKLGGNDLKIDSFIMKAQTLREAALQRGSRIIACRARGM